MRSSRKTGHVWMWVGVVAISFLTASVIAVRYVLTHAQPILQARVIQTLSTRFHSTVELGAFDITMTDGIQVTGGGLKIFGATDPNPTEPGFQPLLGIEKFRFQTSIRNLFRSPMHVDTVFVDGLELNIPPKENRQEIKRLRSNGKGISIFVDKFVCENTKLVINTLKPGKMPLEFDIENLTLKDFGPGQPFHFDAMLINPKPVGNIHSTGYFGPWEPEDPRDTKIQGDYYFSHADLSTIKGIGGMLSSTGQYSGTLSNISVRGTTDTPDFSIATSGHPVPLHTQFDATVDGTTGDTYLHPVNATLLHSSFTAKGAVVRTTTPHGHDIELEVVLNNARIEDLLQLGVHTEPPIMTGPVEMNVKMSLPPGEKSVTDKLKLSGTFHVPHTFFTNQKLQGRLDTLSLISQGKPKEAHEHLEQNVPTDLRGEFTLNDGQLNFSFLHFLIPGTHVDMTGVYSLDGKTFDFHGKAMLDAKLSQMTTGWKSILLKPVDPFFHKNGVGTEVPIKISGTESEPHFGLDLGRKGDHDAPPKKNDTLSQRR
jgi:hypothetical protein